MAKPTRAQGAEWRVAGWLARHPAITATPPVVGAGLIELGPLTTGSIAAAGAAGLLGWYRGHPATFDPILGARLRASRRRWTDYIGHRWADIMANCDLARENRRTGVL